MEHLVSYRGLHGKSKQQKKNTIGPRCEEKRTQAFNKHLKSTHRKAKTRAGCALGAFCFPCPELEGPRWAMFGSFRQGRRARANHEVPVCVGCMS